MQNYAKLQRCFRSGKSAGTPFRTAALQMKGTFKMKSKSLILSAVVALAGFLPQSQAALYDSFAVLGGTTVTSIGSTVLHGDLGVSPGTSITGFSSIDGGPGNVTGAIDNNDTTAINAHSAAVTEYNTLNGLEFNQDLTGKELGVVVVTLGQGVYHFDTTAQLTGTLTLTGDSNARFVFQIGSTLGTADHSIIVLSGGVQAGNVFWQVGSAATLGANTTFNGSIFANTSITMGNQTSMTGIAFANTGAVSLNDNDITAVPEAAAFWPLVFCASVFGAWQWLAVWRRKGWSFLKMVAVAAGRLPPPPPRALQISFLAIPTGNVGAGFATILDG
jgi:hypothetical protein